MLSFWEKDHFLDYDHVIIGGGIVGLSTAVSIKEKAPQKKVLVLERGVFPTGASTKNAGFSCFGSLTELLSDLAAMSSDEVLKLVEWRWKGLQLLRKRLGESQIDYHQYGGYELLTQEQSSALDQMNRVNDLLRPLFRKNVYSIADDKIKVFGFNNNSVAHMVFNPFEGQIHTGKMMKTLQHLATSLKIEVLTGVLVESIEEYHDGVKVIIDDDLKFNTRNLALCTNAFSKKLIPELPLEPGRGTVLITEPIPGLPFKGTFHYDEGYYYFRNYEDHIIFGGGRNLDIEAERTTDFAIREQIMKKLQYDLKHLILPDRKFKIAHSWVGIMAFGDTKQPILSKHSHRIFLGLRLGGMGVAIGSQLGLELSDMMLAD